MFDLGVYCSVYGTLLFFFGLFGSLYLRDKQKCENELLVCSSLEELLLVYDRYSLKLKEEKEQVFVVIFYLFAFSLFLYLFNLVIDNFVV